MKSLLFFFLFVSIIPFTASAQTEVNDGTHRNFSIQTTRNAEYPGGDKALYTRLYELTQYPPDAKLKHIEGDVMLSLFVESDSSVKDITVLRDPGSGLGEEAVRIIKLLKFSPALQNGKIIRQNMMLSVPFRIYE